MAGLTITSANSVLLLSIDGVFPVPQQVQGFAVDEAFDVEATETAIAEIGVDGFAVSGWVPRLTPMTITLQPSSPSFPLFETWIQVMDQVREVRYASGIVILPAIQRKYSFPQGTLTRFPAIPNVRRTLQQRQFTVTWGWPVTGAPV